MRYLTVPQVAKLRRVHPGTVRRWIQTGVLPDRRPPGTRKIIIAEADILSPRTATDLCAKAEQ